MNLRDYLLILRRRKWIGIVVLVAALATSAVLTTLATPLYQSRASLFVGPQGSIESGPGVSARLNLDLALAERLTTTYTQMIRTYPVAERAVREGDLPVAPGYVLARIQVANLEDTQLIEISVTDADPTRAANIANSVGEAFVTIAQNLTSPVGQDNPIVPVTLFEEALVPNSPISPNAARNMVLAGVLGVLGGIGLMFVADFLDVAVRGPEDVERLVHLPVLALIPRITRTDLVEDRSRRPERVRVGR